MQAPDNRGSYVARATQMVSHNLSLFYPLSGSDLARWARSLVHFRICTSSGGLGDDNGVWIETRISYTDKHDLDRTLKHFDLSLKKMPPYKPPEPIESTLFYDVVPHDALAPTAISSLPDYQQIGHCEVGEEACFVWIDETSIKFHFGTNWTVTAGDVALAQEFEKRFDQLVDRIIDPPIDNSYCLCPKYYPQLWSKGSKIGKLPQGRPE